MLWRQIPDQPRLQRLGADERLALIVESVTLAGCLLDQCSEEELRLIVDGESPADLMTADLGAAHNVPPATNHHGLASVDGYAAAGRSAA